MRYTPRKKDIGPRVQVRLRIGWAIAFGAVAMLAGPQMPTADAQEVRALPVINGNAEVPAIAAAPLSTPKRSRLAGRYFVDFRARTAASYGHAFVWYGRLNEHGKVDKIEVAGLHPASDSPVPYILGHIMPVPAETGKSYGDLDEQYLTANYRVYLSEADAKKVFAYIQHKQANSPFWFNGVYNCTAFIADIAAYMGLRTPPTATWMYPETMVNALKEINHGREEIVLAASH
ncbi:MAG TPA: hypothetical protein VKP67_22160 [Xanthobacteraceae bacterium]|nr:hypothetical protein [Xanthobacteraceae bacterium]